MDMRSLTMIPLLLISLLLIPPSAQSTEVRYCDKNADYDVKVHSVEITPDPVARGQPATFSISASTGKVLTCGKLNIDVAYFGWHVYSESHDLCTETSCPVPTGNFVIAHSQVLPGFTPPGSYSLKMTIVDSNNKQLSCVGFDFSIGFGSSVAAS